MPILPLYNPCHFLFHHPYIAPTYSQPPEHRGLFDMFARVYLSKPNVHRDIGKAYPRFTRNLLTVKVRRFLVFSFYKETTKENGKKGCYWGTRCLIPKPFEYLMSYQKTFVSGWTCAGGVAQNILPHSR